MKKMLFFLLLFSFCYQNLAAQKSNIPPSIKKIDYANREITFSNVTMNGQKTTYLEVSKGAEVKITTKIESRRNGDYCPGCIVQVYWGIHDFTSVCGKSFGGYQFKKNKSKYQFQAPLKDGDYYITMGGSLEYSCKNNIERPNCSRDYAFAVLKVGNPDLEQEIAFQKEKKNDTVHLKTQVVKPGGFGNLNTLEWFFDGEKLENETRTEIPLTKFGNYKAVWSNCLTTVTDSIMHTSNDITEIVIGTDPALAEDATPEESDDIAVMIETKDKFVLQHLIFDLNRWQIKLEAAAELNKLAQIMKSKPNMKILLEGHTAIGNARKNRILSEKRVKSTKDYLVEQGVPKAAIETKGWGQQKPLVITRDIAKGKVNRRVEIQILAR